MASTDTSTVIPKSLNSRIIVSGDYSAYISDSMMDGSSSIHIDVFEDLLSYCRRWQGCKLIRVLPHFSYFAIKNIMKPAMLFMEDSDELQRMSPVFYKDVSQVQALSCLIMSLRTLIVRVLARLFRGWRKIRLCILLKGVIIPKKYSNPQQSNYRFHHYPSFALKKRET